MARLAASFLSILILVGAAGCVTQADLPEDCQAASVEREATLTGNRLDPEAIAVCKGQELTLTITADRAGEIHLHGYDNELEVQPGDTATVTFSTTLAGQFPIELHPPDEGPEVEIGILTVNEP